MKHKAADMDLTSDTKRIFLVSEFICDDLVIDSDNDMML